MYPGCPPQGWQPHRSSRKSAADLCLHKTYVGKLLWLVNIPLGITKSPISLHFSSSFVTFSSSTLLATAMTPSRSWEIIKEAYPAWWHLSHTALWENTSLINTLCKGQNSAQAPSLKGNFHSWRQQSVTAHLFHLENDCEWQKKPHFLWQKCAVLLMVLNTIFLRRY